MFQSSNFSHLCLFSVIVFVQSSVLASPNPYHHLIQKAAQKHSIDPALIRAVIKQESAYNRYAVSSAGAQGLMQLMPDTAKRFRVKNAFIPAQNINAGSQYLAWLLKRFKGNTRFALAGYNAGEGKVDRYNGIPPYRETRKYVRKVMGYYRSFKSKPSGQTSVRRMSRNRIAKQHQSIIVAAQHLLVSRNQPIATPSIVAVSKNKLRKNRSAKSPPKNTYADVITHFNQQVVRLKKITTHRLHSASAKSFSPSAVGYSRLHAASQRGG